jgi:hypothetical protein
MLFIIANIASRPTTGLIMIGGTYMPNMPTSKQILTQ